MMDAYFIDHICHIGSLVVALLLFQLYCLFVYCIVSNLKTQQYLHHKLTDKDCSINVLLLKEELVIINKFDIMRKYVCLFTVVWKEIYLYPLYK